MAITLSIQKLSKSFKDNHVLREVNLDIKSPEIVGIIGRSGCGKSTLLKILVGYHKQDSGRILLNEKNISGDTKGLRRAVGYTTQENSFYEKLTVIENMHYYANLYRIPHKTSTPRIRELLTSVGLYSHRKTLAGSISGGMKRRLDFAISLLHNPSILLLDEPTTGLDPMLTDQFWKIVQKVIAEEGKVAVISSHILSEIEEYCTKAALMDNGQIVRVFRKEEMKGLESKFRKELKHDADK